MDYSHNQNVLLIGASTGKVYMLRHSEKIGRLTFKRPGPGKLVSVKFVLRSNYVVAAVSDGAILLWTLTREQRAGSKVGVVRMPVSDML